MESAIRSQTIERLREPWLQRVLPILGSTDRHLTQLFHPGINARRDSLGDIFAAFPCVIVAYASQAIPLFSHRRSHTAVQSPEARQDRDRRLPATRRRWRCCADCPATPPARRHTRPVDLSARRRCRASAPGTAAAVSWTTSVDYRCAGCPLRAVASVVFGAGHRLCTDRWQIASADGGRHFVLADGDFVCPISRRLGRCISS